VTAQAKPRRGAKKCKIDHALLYEYLTEKYCAQRAPEAFRIHRRESVQPKCG